METEVDQKCQPASALIAGRISGFGRHETGPLRFGLPPDLGTQCSPYLQ